MQIIESGMNIPQILYQPQPFNFKTKPRSPQQLIMRRERQTFRRLERSDTVCLAVRTTLHTLDQLSLLELQILVGDMMSWPEQVAKYKGLHCWGDCALAYCRKRGLEVPKMCSSDQA